MRMPVDRLALQEIVYRLREPDDKCPVPMPVESDSRIPGRKSPFGVLVQVHDGLQELLRVLQTVPVLGDLSLSEPWGLSRLSVGFVGNGGRAAANQPKKRP